MKGAVIIFFVCSLSERRERVEHFCTVIPLYAHSSKTNVPFISILQTPCKAPSNPLQSPTLSSSGRRRFYRARSSGNRRRGTANRVDSSIFSSIRLPVLAQSLMERSASRLGAPKCRFWTEASKACSTIVSRRSKQVHVPKKEIIFNYNFIFNYSFIHFM